MGTGCSSEKSGSMVQLNRDNIPNYKVVLIGPKKGLNKCLSTGVTLSEYWLPCLRTEYGYQVTKGSLSMLIYAGNSCDPGVGKTNVLLRYSKRQFDYSYRPTQKVTINHVVEKINVPQNMVVSLTIWDIPGSEDMDLRNTYYRNVDAVIAVVDMSDVQSIELAGIWKQDFINKATKTKETVETLPSGIQTTHVQNVKDFDPRSIPVLLLGNKYDIVEEKLQREKMKETLEPDTVDEIFRPMDENVEEGKEEQSRTGSNQLDSELENRLFTPQRGPGHDEEVPECVKMLEELEEKHKFIGSVMVSAKDDDGSVDAAMKSLVRYLLDKSKFIQPKKSKEKKEKLKQKKNKPKLSDYKNLSTVGIQEFDTVFTRCDVPVKRSGDYETYYDLCLKKVKQSCADQGYITESGSSLEDCIVALREAVSESFGREMEVENDDEFVRLTFNLNSEDDEDKIKIKQNRPLLTVLDNFHTEYASVCKAVLRDGPNIIAVLEKLNGKVENHMETLDSKVKDMMMKNVPEGKPTDGKVFREKLEITKATCDRNRARVAHAQKQMQVLMNKVEIAAKKIKASLIW